MGVPLFKQLAVLPGSNLMTPEASLQKYRCPVVPGLTGAPVDSYVGMGSVEPHPDSTKLYPLLTPPARLESIRPAAVDEADVLPLGGPRADKVQVKPLLGYEVL